MPSLANPFHGDVIHPVLTLQEQEACVDDPIEMDAVIDRLTASNNPGDRGRIVLLKTPRAGYGKTFLIRRLTEKYGSLASFVCLPLECEGPHTWLDLHRRLLDQLLSTPGEQVPSQLDSIVRHVLARAIAGLIELQQIPTHNPEDAIRELVESPLQTLDFTSDAAETAVCRWFRTSCSDLSPLLARHLSAETGLPTDAAGGWLDLLCAFTTARQGDSAGCHREEARRRLYAFAAKPMSLSDGDCTGPSQLPTQEQAQPSPSAPPGGLESPAKHRLLALCALLSLPRPLVILLDGLDGLFDHPEVGKVIAYQMSEIQSSSRRTSFLLATNEDLWQSAFGHQLPSALEDRLTTDVITRKGIDTISARQLLRERMQRAGIGEETMVDFLHFLSRNNRPEQDRLVAPRRVLRMAAEKWQIFTENRKKQERTEPEDRETKASSPAPPRESKQQVAELLSGKFPLQIEQPGTPLHIFDDSLRSSLTEAMSDLVANGNPWAAQAPNDPASPSLLTDPGSQAVAPSSSSPASQPAPAQTTDPAPCEDSPDQSTIEPSALSYFDEPSHPLIPEADQPELARASGEKTTSDEAGEGEDRHRASFARIREMLQQLRKEREQPPSTSPRKNGTEPAVVPTASPECEPASQDDESSSQEKKNPQAPAPASSCRPYGKTGDTRAIFQQLASTLSPDPADKLQQDRLARLIRTSGSILPDIRLSEFKLTDDDPRVITKWGYHNRETLFGFASLDDSVYWQTLSAFVAKRAALKNSLGQKSRNPGTFSMVKLAVFSSPSLEAATSALLGRSPGGAFTDVIVLSAEETSLLYAADLLLEKAQLGEIDQSPDAILSSLSSELEPVWNRITRPLPN